MRSAGIRYMINRRNLLIDEFNSALNNQQCSAMGKICRPMFLLSWHVRESIDSFLASYFHGL